MLYAKHNRVRGYAQQFESLRRLAGQIAQVWADHLAMTDLQCETLELERAMRASVNAAAQKYAVPSGVRHFPVDLSKIEASVRSLSLGEYVILDLEGRPVPKNK